MKKLLPVLVVLALTAVACNLPGSETQTPGLPTVSIPTVSIPTVALPTVMPSLPAVFTATSLPPLPTVQLPTVKIPTLQITVQPTVMITLPPLKTVVPPGIALFPAGTKLDILKVQMFSKSAGWAVGVNLQTDPHNQHVLRTSDGGAGWKDVTPPEPPTSAEQGKAAKAFFLDEQRAWVTYTPQPKPTNQQPGPVVWRTADGGATWQKGAPLDLGATGPELVGPDSPFFLPDGKTGWVIVHAGVGMNHDYIFIFRTTNGGQSWSKVVDPMDAAVSNIMSCEKTGLAFASASLGWLTGTCNAVAPGVLLFQTQNGGTSWQKLTLPAPAENSAIFSAQNVSCGSEPPVLVSASAGFLPVTCRGMETGVKSYSWAYAASAPGWTWGVRKAPAAAIGSFDFTSTNDGHFVGGGQAFRSADGGKNWNAMGSVTWEGLDLSFLNSSEGWVAARSGMNYALVKTANGGASWAMLAPKVVE